jgi:hypothetical protein
MMLRCVLDGLLLRAEMCPHSNRLIAIDGAEAFPLEAVEALYYELVAASCNEILLLQQAGYRLLRFAGDFQFQTAAA